MMLKGYQRRMIMMPTKGSSLFETAYFVLRHEVAEKQPTQNEMLCEAMRILEENALNTKKRVIGIRHLLWTAAVSFFLGAFLLGMIWLSAAV